MSDIYCTKIDECLACLSLEELAEVAVVVITEVGVIVIPENQPFSPRPLVIVTSDEKADEVDRYLRSVFGKADSGEALDMARAWRRGKALDKLTSHAEVHNAWLGEQT